MSFKFLAKIGNIFITRKCLLSFFEITKFGYNWNKKTAPKRSGSLLCLACVIYRIVSIKLPEEALHLAADISSAQRVVGIGKDAVEINDPIRLRVDDGRVERVASLVACGVAFGLIKDCSYDVAHKFFQFFLVIEFIAFDIAVCMYDNAIAVPCGLNQLSKCFGYFKAWDVGGFEV